MRNFNVLTLLAVAVIALSACSSDDNAYLGSRDDIIINNKKIPKAEKAAATQVVEAEKSAETVMTKAADIVTPTPAPTAVVTETPVTPTATAAAPVTQTATTTPVVAAPVTATAAPVPAPQACASCNVSQVPPSATPGECYAKMLIPAVTQTQTERVQVAEEQKVLNRIIPAQYRVETEQVLIKEGRKYWKQGHGAITKVDQVTGEILCLIEEPPVYKTIEKRILVAPEKPEYRLVPAQFENVSKTQIVKPECWEWRRVLCETNMTRSMIQTIQNALRAKGYKVAVDGNLGSETLNAVRSYQKKNGLAAQGLTYETLNHLGIRLTGGA